MYLPFISCPPSPWPAFHLLFPLQHLLSSSLSLILEPLLQFHLLMLIDPTNLVSSAFLLLFLPNSLRRPCLFFLSLFETPLSVFELIFVIGQACFQPLLPPFPLQFNQLDQLEKKKEKDEKSHMSTHPGQYELPLY